MSQDEEPLPYKPILRGEALKSAIDATKDERTPLIEGLLYEHNTIQFFADDGLGKSIILLNIALQASAGVSVFSALSVPRPLKVIYFVAERPLDEPFERIKMMATNFEPNYDNIIFDKEIQNWDVKTPEGRANGKLRVAECANEFPGGKFDLLIIDPLYAIVSGGLSGDIETHFCNSFLRSIQNTFSCSIIYTHHTNRGVKKDKSSGRHEGDMYGSRFLSANLTGQYHVKKTDDGVDLNCTKNTYGNLITHIPLVYDELSQTSSMSLDSDHLRTKDAVMIFLRSKFSNGSAFELDEMIRKLKVSSAYIRKIIGPLIKSGAILNQSKNGEKGSYKVVKNV